MVVGVTVATFYGDAGVYSDKDCDDTVACATQHLTLIDDVLSEINELSSR